MCLHRVFLFRGSARIDGRCLRSKRCGSFNGMWMIGMVKFLTLAHLSCKPNWTPFHSAARIPVITAGGV